MRARLATLVLALLAAVWLAARSERRLRENPLLPEPLDTANSTPITPASPDPPDEVSARARRRPITPPRAIPTIEERARRGERVAITATAYCLQGRTRRGNLVRDGIVAADPKLFRLGSSIRVWVGRRELGSFLVDDTGKDIKGGRLDVWMSDCAAARRFGRRRGYAQAVR